MKILPIQRFHNNNNNYTATNMQSGYPSHIKLMSKPDTVSFTANKQSIVKDFLKMMEDSKQIQIVESLGDNITYFNLDHVHHQLIKENKDGLINFLISSKDTTNKINADEYMEIMNNARTVQLPRILSERGHKSNNLIDLMKELSVELKDGSKKCFETGNAYFFDSKGNRFTSTNLSVVSANKGKECGITISYPHLPDGYEFANSTARFDIYSPKTESKGDFYTQTPQEAETAKLFLALCRKLFGKNDFIDNKNSVIKAVEHAETNYYETSLEANRIVLAAKQRLNRAIENKNNDLATLYSASNEREIENGVDTAYQALINNKH